MKIKAGHEFNLLLCGASWPTLLFYGQTMYVTYSFILTPSLFSRASAERDLSSLYGMFLYVELGDPPARFHGSIQNATPLLYDCRFDMTKKTPRLNFHVHMVMLHLYESQFFRLQIWLYIVDPPSQTHGCIWSRYTSFTKGNFFWLQIWLDVVDSPQLKFYECNL